MTFWVISQQCPLLFGPSCHLVASVAETGEGGETQTFWARSESQSQRAIHSASGFTAGSNIKRGGASRRGKEKEGQKEST